jgi:NitT/TauT family transport system permease protein
MQEGDFVWNTRVSSCPEDGFRAFFMKDTRQQPFLFNLANWINCHRSVMIFLIIGLTILAWQSLVWIFQFPPFILPTPWAVLTRFGKALADNTLTPHAAFTLLEVLLGLAIGVFFAILIGYPIAKSHIFEKLASPFLVASQAIPVVAIAPLLVIWFGPGLLSKVLICSLIVFFPVLVNTVVGLRAVSENLRDVMRSMNATPRQILRYLEIPGAMPVFLGGLRIGATLSVVGAVVGEFVGSDRGLGFLINIARGQYDTALVFVSIITLVLVALMLYGLVVLLERRLLSWQHNPEKDKS